MTPRARPAGCSPISIDGVLAGGARVLFSLLSSHAEASRPRTKAAVWIPSASPFGGQIIEDLAFAFWGIQTRSFFLAEPLEAVSAYGVRLLRMYIYMKNRVRATAAT